MKQFSLGDIFTAEELDRARSLFEEDERGFVARAVVEIVRPAMPRINAATGQENDERYIGYALQHALQQFRAAPKGP